MKHPLLAVHMASDENPEVQRGQPRIEGTSCEEIIAIQYWHAGALVEPVNSVHLKFAGDWHRLCFDCGIIFWRAGNGPPTEEAIPELQAEYKIDELGQRHGLLGLTLASIRAESTERGARVVLKFEDGRALIFFNENDRSDYAC